ncbi:MFS transporter [Auraticoccus monumenti]|uniref:MFS transporter, DHA1 family, arabinose polymer transporter n=1 Tax=Auraticoccus monumenti TaxID=675864 RepID=A0A1G7CC83_9ACTN|nr:MFS transporter [Auraticoccus monumenti]SDE35995.1 MFS transporter, DHA1 family, arabinose polymer transporter [Auraticoccus monumenti]
MRSPIPIYALALTSFALGTAEFAPNGQLSSVSDGFAVSVADAGLITTGFAIGATIGGPLIAAATLRVPHKRLTLVLVSVFLVANVVTAVSPGLLVAVLSRAVAGAVLGTFMGVAVTIASDLVAPARRGRAIALVFSGLTISNVLGVVIGNLAGNASGWRSVFWFVTGLALISLIGLLAVLPRQTGAAAGSSGSVGRALRTGRLWLTYGAMALAYAGLFTMFTYIEPMLQERGGASSGAVVWLLLVFGVGLVLGTHVAGHLADRSIRSTTVTAMIALVVALVAFSLLGTHLVAVVVLLPVLGAAGYGMVPPLQSFAVEIAEVTSPVVSALAAAAFMAGVSLGSAVGGEILRRGGGYEELPLVGAGLTVLGLLVFLSVDRLHGRATAAALLPRPVAELG